MPRHRFARPISEHELAVLTRMLEQCAMKGPLSINRSELPKLNVVARCDCGCDTVDFKSIDWSKPPSVIADGQGKTESGGDVGIIVFGDEAAIACLEVYNHTDEPARLPVLESITPYGIAQSAF